MINKLDQRRMGEIADRAAIFAMEIARESDDIVLFNPNEFRSRVILALALVHERTPLKLDALFYAKYFDFVHDVWGILRHINYQTGELTDCFVPRYAKVNHEKDRADKS